MRILVTWGAGFIGARRNALLNKLLNWPRDRF